MSILKILQYPDLRLRNKAHQVGNVKAPRIQKIIDDMIETLEDQDSCAGLASTQLDIENPPSITVINNDDGILCLINLEILETEGIDSEDEGCMSVCPQNIQAKVERASKIKASALDRDGNKLLFDTTGFLARCLQHEHDHLKGALYIDHLSKEERENIDKKISELNS